MPFKKVSQNNYRSPSGRKYTKKQVQAYYTSDGFKKRKVTNSRKKKSR